MNNYDKKIDSSYIEYLDANNLYGWAMSQKLPINGLEWVKNLSKINEDFIKKYIENSDKGCFLEVDLEYSKTLFNSHEDLPFLPERKKNNKSRETYLQYRRQRKICCSYKSLKTSTKSWLKVKKSIQSN